MPPLGDEDEDDQFHDPFAAHRAPSQEDEEEGGHGDTKDKICWSYSSYMAALHKEDILNNTDESTFSSLMSDTGKGDTLNNTDENTFSSLMSDTCKGSILNKNEESTLSSLISDTVFCPSSFLSDSPNFSPCPLQFSMKQLEGQLKVQGYSLVSVKVKVIHNGSHLEIILFPMNTCFLFF